MEEAEDEARRVLSAAVPGGSCIPPAVRPGAAGGVGVIKNTRSWGVPSEQGEVEALKCTIFRRNANLPL